MDREMGCIRGIEGTRPEMLAADLWIGKEKRADEVLLSAEEIEWMNVRNPQLLCAGEVAFALGDVPEVLPGVAVARFVSKREAPKAPETLYLAGKPTEMAYWEALVQNAALEAIPETVRVRFVFSVTRSTLRAYTTFDFVSKSPDDRYFDVCLRAELFPFLPVAVVHESANGECFYALASASAGWAKREWIALCPSREDWLLRQRMERFLLVTGEGDSAGGICAGGSAFV